MDLLQTLLPYVATGGTFSVIAVAAVIVYFAANPEKVEKWAAMLWSAVARMRHEQDRRAVKYSLQSHVNSMAVDIARQTGRAAAVRAEIEWIAEGETPGHFFSEDLRDMRLHRKDREDRNLVTASLLLVSETLVPRAKTLLSKTQARSVDLYAAERVLENSTPARQLFHEEILGPETDGNRELRALVRKYQLMDRGNLFFPVFVRELTYLGQKVLLKPRDEHLITEVREFVDFLVAYTERQLGDDTTKVGIEGRALRCAIMIIAKKGKRLVGRTDPYLKHLGNLRQRGFETIYVVGSASRENKKFMEGIVDAFCGASDWRRVHRASFTSSVKVQDGRQSVETHLICLRSSAIADDMEDLADAGESLDQLLESSEPDVGAAQSSAQSSSGQSEQTPSSSNIRAISRLTLP